MGKLRQLRHCIGSQVREDASMYLNLFRQRIPFVNGQMSFPGQNSSRPHRGVFHVVFPSSTGGQAPIALRFACCWV